LLRGGRSPRQEQWKAQGWQMAALDTIQFVPLTPPLVGAAEAFNRRLRQAGTGLSVFATTPNRDRGDGPPAPMELERFVGVDSGGEVRGAYSLRWQFLWLRGERFLGAAPGYPVSEGVIDRRYAMVGVSVLRDAVRRCEYLYALGSNGRTGNWFRVAQHTGWSIADVPFLFRVINGARFFRRLPQMQGRVERRALATIGSATGLAQVATRLLHAGCALRNHGSSSLRQPSDVTVDCVRTLAEAADEVWPRVSSRYAFCVVRDAAHVEPCYPPDRTDLDRLVVRHRGRIVGWAVVMTRGLSRLRAYLGDIVPGLVVDAFGEPAHASEIVGAATAHLADRDVDVVITNTSHRDWCSGYKCKGFIAWPSQFPLLASRALAGRIGELDAVMPQMHLSRGDSDGVHYLQ
jgi:hypothetical protein